MVAAVVVIMVVVVVVEAAESHSIFASFFLTDHQDNKRNQILIQRKNVQETTAKRSNFSISTFFFLFKCSIFHYSNLLGAQEFGRSIGRSAQAREVHELLYRGGLRHHLRNCLVLISICKGSGKGEEERKIMGKRAKKRKTTKS